jgi:hypothetical protein
MRDFTAACSVNEWRGETVHGLALPDPTDAESSSAATAGFQIVADA